MKLLNRLFGKRDQKPRVLNSSDREHICAQWRNIEELVKLSKPSQLRQAIIEADKLLELVLKKLVDKNQSLGENLKQAKDLFPSWEDYQKAWEAHKVRNALVHETEYELPHYLAKEALDNFEKSLRILGAL
ncbi:MAG: hypothetical protein ABH826_02875 [Patescibacteria group bacterium]